MLVTWQQFKVIAMGGYEMCERKVLNILYVFFVVSTFIVGLSLVLLSGSAIYSLTSEKESEKQEKIYEMVTRPINLTEKILLLLGGGTTLIAGLREIQLNRLKSAHEFVINNILCEVIKLRDWLAVHRHNIYSQNPCADVHAITKGDEVSYKIISLLNQLDYMCIAINTEIVDEELIEKSAKYLLINTWRYFLPAINRFCERNPNAWDSLRQQHSKWNNP